jgi:hypothetical protein
MKLTSSVAPVMMRSTRTNQILINLALLKKYLYSWGDLERLVPSLSGGTMPPASPDWTHSSQAQLNSHPGEPTMACTGSMKYRDRHRQEWIRSTNSYSFNEQIKDLPGWVSHEIDRLVCVGRRHRRLPIRSCWRRMHADQERYLDGDG